MGQIVGGAAKPKRCNISKLSQLGTPAAGEYILVSSDNSMNAAGQGNFDCYIEGDGSTAATSLPLRYFAADNFDIETDTTTTTTPVSSPNVGYMNDGGQVFPSATNYIYTDSIPVLPGDKIILAVNGNNVGERFLTAFYNGSVVTALGGQNLQLYTVPNGVDAVVMSTPATNQPLSYKLTRTTVTPFLKSERIKDGTISESKIANGAVTSAKIADGAVGFDKQSSEVIENTLNAKRSANLYNDLFIIDGKYINNSGDIMSASGWAITPKIPVVGGQSYTISCASSARDTGINWYDSNGDRITSVAATTAIYGTHTAPSGATHLQFNVGASGSYSQNVMVANSYSAVDYAPYTQITPEQVKGFTEAAKDAASGGGLSVTKNGNNLTIASGVNSIACVLEKNYGNIYNNNPVFNIMSTTFNGTTIAQGDEVAPCHALNTTIGANHGQPASKAKITSHGFTNEDIGTYWLDANNVKFYIMNIIDANNVLLLSENQGTMEAPSFVALSAGTITKGSGTKTVEAVTSFYLMPALKNHSIRLVKNGSDEITEDGTYGCDTLDVVEEYEIMNPASTLQKIIARAGQSDAPEYDGDTAITIKNVYKFESNLAVVVIATFVPNQSIKFGDIMFNQAVKIGDNTVKYYIPNSLPLANGAYDFRQPLAVSWSNSIPSMSVKEAQMENPSIPVNRVVQYANSFGFALGFLTDRGIGTSLLDYTTDVFELRNNTGKIYPHGVNSAEVGTPLSVGQMYTAVMYRCLFNKPTSGNRMSMYSFDLDNSTYVYVDYSGTMTDFVSVSDKLNGRKIEVIESSNAVLKTDVYNGGFYVNANYVTNETCYIVVKI